MWHIRLEEAQMSMWREYWKSVPEKSVPREGLANMPRQGIGKRSQAGNCMAKRPMQGLQNVPRQGTGKLPGGDGKRADAGHWQMFPGREPWTSPGRRLKALQKSTAQKSLAMICLWPLRCQPAGCCVMSLHSCLHRCGTRGYINVMLPHSFIRKARTFPFDTKQ